MTDIEKRQKKNNTAVERLERILAEGSAKEGTSLSAEQCAIALDYVQAMKGIMYDPYLRGIDKMMQHDRVTILTAVAHLASREAARADSQEPVECPSCGRSGL